MKEDFAPTQLSRFDALASVCLIVLTITVTWLSVGDDRTTTKGWFLAWFEQFRSYKSGEYPYSPFPPTAVLLEGGIPLLFTDPFLGDDIWHVTVLSLLGPTLYVGLRKLANSLLSFTATSLWIALEGTSIGTFIGGYAESASLFLAASCTMLIWSNTERVRRNQVAIFLAGMFAAFAVGVKQSFLPFLIAITMYFIFVRRATTPFCLERKTHPARFLAAGIVVGTGAQMMLWQFVFPGLSLLDGLLRFVSGGGKADSLRALISSAANSLTPLNAVAGTALVTSILFILTESRQISDGDRRTLAGASVAVGACGFFLWSVPVTAEQGALRLAVSVWLATLFLVSRRDRTNAVRLTVMVPLLASSIIFVFSFSELVLPDRQYFGVTFRGLASAPSQLAGYVVTWVGLVGFLLTVGGIRWSSHKEIVSTQSVAVGSGTFVLFQIPLGGFSLTAHLFGFGLVLLLRPLERYCIVFVQGAARVLIVMVALSGIVRETVSPYEWYGVSGSNDLAQVQRDGTFVDRDAAEGMNRFEHALLRRELAGLEDGTRMLAGVRNAGLLVGYENLVLNQQCLVLWFDICPEHLAKGVLNATLRGEFDFALWSLEDPDVIFANTLMWRDDGSSIGNPPAAAVASLQSLFEALIVAEPWRVVFVAWPEREDGTKTLLIDLREMHRGGFDE